MKSIKLLILIPIIGYLGSLHWANRIEPYVMGLPFLLFWLVLWMVLSSIILTIVYKLDPDNKDGETK